MKSIIYIVNTNNTYKIIYITGVTIADSTETININLIHSPIIIIFINVKNLFKKVSYRISIDRT